jgi:hypothetical protein
MPDGRESGAGPLLTRRALLGAAALILPGTAAAQPVHRAIAEQTIRGLTVTSSSAAIWIAWSRVVAPLTTQASLQVVANPLLRRDSPIHDRAFAHLRVLGAPRVRFVPWYPYPRLSVPELGSPTSTRTTWDFRDVDPMMVDFMHATAGRSPIVNFSTIPAWMWTTAGPIALPGNPNTVDFGYGQGTDLAVPVSTVGAYYRRLVSWYTEGGFRDELGRRHVSGHRFKVEYWEVLNEIDAEHALTPRDYTELYDEIVTQVSRVSPRTQFIGLALSSMAPQTLAYVRYFLDPVNHRPGIPRDWISYHFYVAPSRDTQAGWGLTSFPKVDAFLARVDAIESLRLRLSPSTRTAVDEAGTLLRGACLQAVPEAIPDLYWNFSAAIFAYLYANLAMRGIDLVCESQLVGLPGQYPSVTMLDWRTGLPNARYRVLELLLNSLSSAMLLCAARASDSRLFGLGLRTRSGERCVLLINKGDSPLAVRLQGLKGASVAIVDGASAGGPPRREDPRYHGITLSGYAVAVAHLQRSRHR